MGCPSPRSAAYESVATSSAILTLPASCPTATTKVYGRVLNPPVTITAGRRDAPSIRRRRRRQRGLRGTCQGGVQVKDWHGGTSCDFRLYDPGFEGVDRGYPASPRVDLGGGEGAGSISLRRCAGPGSPRPPRRPCGVCPIRSRATRSRHSSHRTASPWTNLSAGWAAPPEAGSTRSPVICTPAAARSRSRAGRDARSAASWPA